MQEFNPFYFLLLGDQLGKRVSRRACYAIHKALRTVSVLGFDVEEIPAGSEAYRTQVQKGVRLALRENEDEETNAAEYAAILLHHQQSRIIESGYAGYIISWTKEMFRAGKIREMYHWHLMRDLLPYPNHHRGPKHDQ